MVDVLKQIENVVNETEDGYYSWSELYYGTSVSLGDLGDATRVDSGGGEGDGAAMWVVFSISTLPGRLFRKGGTYNSWDSDYWDDPLEEVEPYEATVTLYRRV